MTNEGEITGVVDEFYKIISGHPEDERDWSKFRT